MNAQVGGIVSATLAEAMNARHAAQEEAAIVAQAQAGSLDAFSRLVARHQAGVFNYLRRRGADRCDAEDLTQETFVRAWTALASYNARWRFSTWLYAIATRLAIDHRRAQRTRQRSSDRRAAGRDSTDPVRPLIEREERRNLWAVAQRALSDDERAALWLKYAENLSSGEIARVMGRSAITVRVMLFRARRTIAAALEEAGSSARDPDDSGATS